MATYIVQIPSRIEGHDEVLVVHSKAEATRIALAQGGTVTDVTRPPSYSSQVVLGRWDNCA